MKKMFSINIERDIIENTRKLAKPEDRSINYYFVKWIKEGFERENLDRRKSGPGNTPLDI